MLPAVDRPTKSLPACPESEKAILAICLNHPSPALAISKTAVLKTDFYDHTNAELFGIMVDEDNEGRPVDPVAIVTKASRGEMRIPVHAIGELVSNCPDPRHLAHYIARVRHASMLRGAIAAAELLAAEAMQADLSDDPSQLLMQAETSLRTLEVTGSINTGDAVTKLWGDLFDSLESGNQASPPIPTGFNPIDAHTRGGPRRGQLVVVAAFRHVGKTAFLRHVALNTASSGFKTLGFFMESAAEEEAVNTLANHASVPSGEISPGSFNPTKGLIQRITASASARLPLHIDTSGRQTMETISAKCRLAKATRGLDVILVDYIQLLATKPGYRTQTREQIISEDAAELKRLARELNCVLYVGAQLSDAAGIDPTTPPEMHHVRECKAIANHADVFLGMSAPEGVEHDPTAAPRGVLRDIWNRKWRGVGAFSRPFQMNFHGSTQRFHPIG